MDIFRHMTHRRFDVQTSWWLQSESTIYSVSVEERATDLCLQLNQEVILSQMVTYLVCDELKYGFKSAYEQS